MLAAAVEVVERLFVQHQAESVTARHFLHDFHEHVVLVAAAVGFCQNGSELKLARSDFVATRQENLSEAVHVALDVFHVGEDAGVNRAEIVRFDGLRLGRRGADERAAAQSDVGAQFCL